jgi:outer membrane protein TolC
LQKALVVTNELELASLRKSIMPKLTIWSVGYGRGSGVAADGSVNNSDGLHFERYNYGLGAQISFPILEIFRQKPLWKQQEFNTEVSKQELEQTRLELNTHREVADNALQKAVEASHLAPQQLASSLFSYNAILSRYASGLINYYDVIQSQQLLFQSEANVRIAYYNAWKALLNKAAYDGNLNEFLNQYHQ